MLHSPDKLAGQFDLNRIGCQFVSIRLVSLVLVILMLLVSPRFTLGQSVQFRRSSLVPIRGDDTKATEQESAKQQLDQMLQTNEPWIPNRHFHPEIDRRSKVPAISASSMKPIRPQEPTREDALRAFREMVQQEPGLRFKDDPSNFVEEGRTRNATESLPPAPFSLNTFASGTQESSQRQEIEPLPGAAGRTPKAKPEADRLSGRSSRKQEQVVENYPDGKPKVYRTVALDSEGNYLNDGPWRVVDRSGNALAEGNFDRGVMQGKWGRRHLASEGGMFATKPFTSYQGPFDSYAYFRNGKLDGTWIIYDNQKRSIMEVGYKDGVRHGEAAWYYPDRTPMRKATFKNGVLDGEVLEWDADQRVVARDRYYEGRKVIRQTTTYRPTIKQSEVYYLDAKLIPEGIDNWWEAKPTPFVSSGERVQNGPVMGWYSNQQPKYRGQYKDDLPIGQFFWWHENGNRKTVGAYNAQGQRTGRWIWWHANGMKHFEGEYDQGSPVGVWRSWFENGDLRRERDYDAENDLGTAPDLNGFGILGDREFDGSDDRETDRDRDEETKTPDADEDSVTATGEDQPADESEAKVQLKSAESTGSANDVESEGENQPDAGANESSGSNESTSGESSSEEVESLPITSPEPPASTEADPDNG